MASSSPTVVNVSIPDDREEGEALGVLAAVDGGEHDELHGLVLCAEDQAVELDHADGGVSDALSRDGGQRDLVFLPERRTRACA